MDELRRHAESGAEGLEDIFLRLTGENAARNRGGAECELLGLTARCA
jgi:hypothetical protein